MAETIEPSSSHKEPSNIRHTVRLFVIGRHFALIKYQRHNGSSAYLFQYLIRGDMWLICFCLLSYVSLLLFGGNTIPKWHVSEILCDTLNIMRSHTMRLSCTCVSSSISFFLRSWQTSIDAVIFISLDRHIVPVPYLTSPSS